MILVVSFIEPARRTRSTNGHVEQMVLHEGDIEGLVSGVPVVRRGGVLPGECFWASPMLNIMEPQGELFFSMPVDEDAERRQDGGMSPDYFRVPIGASWKTSVTGRFPKNGKPWNKAKNDHTRLSCEARMMMVVMASSVSWA